MVLVTREALDFTAFAVLGNGKVIDNFNLRSFAQNKMVIVFFWPMDFSFIYSTKLITFNKYYSEFKKRNVEVIGVSCDSVLAHNVWRQMDINKGGIGQVDYVMVSDIKRDIIKCYGIDNPNDGTALSCVFLIDKDFIVRHQIVSDLSLDIDVNEIIRIIDAFHFYEKYGEVCPAQWTKGQPGMIASPEGVVKYLSENLDKL